MLYFFYNDRALVDAINQLTTRIKGMDQRIIDVENSTNALVAKVDETIVTLRELKALVDQAVGNNDLTALVAVKDKLDAKLAELTAAEDETDPTPDTAPTANDIPIL